MLTAGEPERLARAKRLANGIPIDTTSWAEILASARGAGLSEPIVASALGFAG